MGTHRASAASIPLERDRAASVGSTGEPVQRRRIRVLVADDHPAVRWGLVHLLEDQPDLDVAGMATTAEAAVSQAEREAIDVAVLDYHLGGRNGLWATQRMKELARPPGVVVFSAFANDHLAAVCAVAGADALLGKGSLGDDVCHAIRAVWRGRTLIPRVAHGIADTLRDRLDDDERLTFGMLLAGIPSAEIAKALRVDARALAARRARMLRKLEALPGEAPPWDRGRRRLDLGRAVLL